MNTYTQSGNYVALVGLVIAAFNHFFPFITLTANDITAVVSGAIILAGVVKQFIDHRHLAIVAGAYPTK